MKNISLELPLKNLARAPKPTSEKSPAIFFLHGFGSNMEDLYSLSSSFPKEWACISLQASIPIELNGWAWADLNFENLSKLPDPDQMRKHQRMVTASIKKSVEELNLDRKRINLLGFSQGASLAIYSGLMNVDLFSTITALCGFMPLEEIGNEIEDKDLSSINLFMGNGIQDPVVAIERAEKTFKNLTDLGITPQFKKYNAEHTISYECLQDVLSFLINNNT